jgi:drug/metabolite transporter (DMT)-like permease
VTADATESPPASLRRAALIKVTVAVVAWGASFIATKVALREAAPVTVVWTRFLLGVPVLGVAVLLRREWAPVPVRDLGFFALLGVLGITFHQWLQSNGLVTARASTTAWIVATVPVFIAILGWFVLRERLRAAGTVGIALAAAGVLLVVTRGDLGALARGRFGEPGDALVLLSAPNWAVFSVLSRRALRAHPAGRMMFYVMLLGWAFTTVLFLAGPGFQDLGRLSPAGWTSIAFLGIVCSGIAYVFWYDALKALPAPQVGAFLYLEPLVAVVVAAALLGERVGWASLLGGAVILLGVWLVSRPSTPVPTPPRRSDSPSPHRSGASPSPSSTPPSSSSHPAGS